MSSHRTWNKNKQSNKDSRKQSDDKVAFIQKEYTNVQCNSCGKMKNISPIFHDKKVNSQVSIEKSRVATTKTVFKITNQNDSVAIESHFHIGGWKCYQQ